MKRMVRSLPVLMVLLLAVACAGPPTAWVSRPAMETTENPFYGANFEPLKSEAGIFTTFRFTLTNRSAEDLEIDWNRTSYIHDGDLAGPFVFEGIDPATARDKTVPPDTVSPGSSLTKEIAPLKYLSTAPSRDKGAGKIRKGIDSGPLPDGENGIYLVVLQKDRVIRGKITVKIGGK